MLRRRINCITLVLGVFFSAGASFAETTLSTSNDSFSAIDSAITAVLNVESRGFNRIPAKQIDRLTTPPEADPLAIVGYSRASLAGLAEANGDKHWRCLTDALYFEARGESVLGQFAVAEVILNRVASASYPDTICGVVKQGTGRKHRCQFSFYCDGKMEIINEPKAFAQVGKVAKIVMAGTDVTLTSGATHYHTKGVSPNWSRVFPKTATIGYHHFYRQPVRVVRN